MLNFNFSENDLGLTGFDNYKNAVSPQLVITLFHILCAHREKLSS